MDKLFSLEYGIGGICVLLTIMILIRVGEFVWVIMEKKGTLSDAAITELTKALQENTVSLKLLDLRIKSAEESIIQIPRLKNDIRRSYAALKELAGERWPKIRDEIMKDGFPL